MLLFTTWELHSVSDRAIGWRVFFGAVWFYWAWCLWYSTERWDRPSRKAMKRGNSGSDR